MKTVLKVLAALVLLYVGYDYYHIRQEAMCAHANTIHLQEGSQ